VAQATNAPIAVEALRRIGEPYAVEAGAHGQPPAQRLAARPIGTLALAFQIRLGSR